VQGDVAIMDQPKVEQDIVIGDGAWLGAMRELLELVGSEWVRCYDGEFDAQELARSLDWARSARSEHALLEQFDWDGIARATIEFYRRVRRDDVATQPAPAPATTAQR
jgi:beta-1,4-mannosyltransferase